MSTPKPGVPASLLPRLSKVAERLGRPVEELIEQALTRYIEEHEHEHEHERERDAAPGPGFDEVVFGEGDSAQKFGAAEFRQLPLRRQVKLLMGKPVHFFREGREIPREQAMSLAGIATR
ncbi:hypothetical protein ENSA5_48150 [Enhygromyxa salina]|uniref:Uncharacterized protein n=1 Tax=Enhygromyxa salina TaxID=215803 RepID=A0A2S9XIF9_9BACT|nr:ribbon-helix-helix protein, CopG family [Enhygromyxa salina]PRP92633.1 hypothetical protein ENSA5_48150 [Enhygromyxa salina]